MARLDWAPSLYEQWDVFAGLECADVEEVGRVPDLPCRGLELGGCRQWDRHDSIRMNAKMGDRLAANGCAIGDDHRGDAELDQGWSTASNAVRGVVPGAVHPGGKVMERHYA